MSAQDPFSPPSSQEWLPPAQMPYQPYAAAQPATAPMFELRPLTTSEVLDRTFALYRSRFWLFAGIASLSGAVQSVAAAIQLVIQARVLRPSAAPLHPLAGAVPVLLSFVAMFLFLLAYSITMAGCVFAVGETYLGRATTIKESMRATLGRWYGYIGIAFWQTGSMIWLPMLLLVPAVALLALRITSMAWLAGVLVFLGVTCGFVVGYIFYLRNSFGVPIAVTERLKVRAAMRRSKVLTQGTKWRVFVVHLISVALYMVVGVLQAPVAFFVAFTVAKGGHAYAMQAVSLIIGFAGHTVVAPVAMIGLTLLYFDQRVRKEAFDIAVLLGEENMVEAGAPAADVPVAAIETQSASEPQAGHAPSL